MGSRCWERFGNLFQQPSIFWCLMHPPLAAPWRKPSGKHHFCGLWDRHYLVWEGISETEALWLWGMDSTALNLATSIDCSCLLITMWWDLWDEQGISVWFRADIIPLLSQSPSQIVPVSHPQQKEQALEWGWIMRCLLLAGKWSFLAGIQQTAEGTSAAVAHFIPFSGINKNHQGYYDASSHEPEMYWV